LLLLLGPAVGVFAMLSNLEMKDTDFPLLICFGALLLWGRPCEAQRRRAEAEGRCGSPKSEGRSEATRWRRAARAAASASATRLYASLLCGLAISELHLGATRARIEGELHYFFEYADTVHSPGVPFFRDMRASMALHRVLTEASEVTRYSARPLYFGPCLEFLYAALGVPSPLHLPLGWSQARVQGAPPPSSYALADEPAIVEAWRRSRFATLIYLRQFGVLGPPALLQTVRDLYVQDDRWPDLIVLHSKPAGPHP
jgi:hypothetical protein